MRRWLLLAFLWSWLSTGLVVGLGNLALVCVASVLAAYPFRSHANAVWLTLAAMKHSLVFPIYLRLLFKRPSLLLVPAVVIGVSGVVALVWARLGPAEMLQMARGSMATVEAWTAYDLTSLRRLFRPMLGGGAALAVVVWVLWFGLYGLVVWRVKDSLAQLAALLLLSLLPLYHQQYDLVAAAPALALFLKRGSLVWPALMTLLLAVNLASIPSHLLPAGFLRQGVEALTSVYVPMLILAFIAKVVWVDADLASQARHSRLE